MRNVELNPISGIIAERRAMQPRIQLTSSDGEITLKQYIPNDARPAFELIHANERHLSQYGDSTGSKYRDAAHFRSTITHPDNPDRLRFGIYRGDQLVGSINLTPNTQNPSQAEIGYYLARMSTGRGITQRAVETLTEYAFNHGYEEIIGRVHANNIASAKVLHRSGYNFEGAGPIMNTFVRRKTI